MITNHENDCGKQTPHNLRRNNYVNLTPTHSTADPAARSDFDLFLITRHFSVQRRPRHFKTLSDSDSRKMASSTPSLLASKATVPRTPHAVGCATNEPVAGQWHHNPSRAAGPVHDVNQGGYRGSPSRIAQWLPRLRLRSDVPQRASSRQGHQRLSR